VRTTYASKLILIFSQTGEACSILARFHSSDGDERDPLVVFELAQIHHTQDREGSPQRNDVNEPGVDSKEPQAHGDHLRNRGILTVEVRSLHLILEGVGIKDPSTHCGHDQQWTSSFQSVSRYARLFPGQQVGPSHAEVHNLKHCEFSPAHHLHNR
jgi:hypothetical protein